MPVDEHRECPRVSSEDAAHEHRIGHATGVYPRERRERHFGSVRRGCSITRTPTSPAKSSLIVVRPGGTIQPAPSTRAFIRWVPEVRDTVRHQLPSSSRESGTGFQLVKSPEISTRRAVGAASESRYRPPPRSSTSKDRIPSGAGRRGATGALAMRPATRRPSVTYRCSRSRTNRPPAPVPAPATIESGDASLTTMLAAVHAPLGTSRVANRPPTANSAAKRSRSQATVASVSCQRRVAAMCALSPTDRVVCTLSQRPVRLSSRGSNVVMLLAKCVIPENEALRLEPEIPTVTSPKRRHPPD